MIKPWAFEFFLAPHDPELAFDPKATQDTFKFYLDLWPRAEAWGYHGIFLSEHHFGLGYSTSPNVLLPLIAHQTKTLRLGVMGNVVPYHSPWRLAEEFGMLDHLLGGRFEIGTSAGIPSEFARIGLQPAEARERYEEALEVIDNALKNPVITHHGKYWNFDNLPMVPRPLQQPEPPKWTTVISVESARKAARRGSKISTGFVTTDKAKEIFDAYNEEAAKAGNPTGPEQLGLRRQITVDIGGTDASEISSRFSKSFRTMLESVDWRTIAPGRKTLDQPGTHGYTLGDDEFIAGSPKQVAEQAIEQCKRSGAGHFQVLFSGYESLTDLARGWEVFGTEVNPALKSA